MDILDTNLLIEGKTGLTAIFNVMEYPPATMKCRILFPRKEDYLKAIEIMVKLREMWKPSPAMDVIIASMCIRRNLKLLTKNIHFLSIKEAVMIGDDIQLDIMLPKMVGIRAILLDRKGNLAKKCERPDSIVNNLNRALEIIETWL